uniref:Uncharacterized protein n=1 Tax=Arundo donax TaxID=35708 RepID=A0A0A9BHV8_ARUDO
MVTYYVTSHLLRSTVINLLLSYSRCPSCLMSSSSCRYPYNSSILLLYG